MLNRTGVGIGGNDGVKNSRVSQEVLKGSHQLPLMRAFQNLLHLFLVPGLDNRRKFGKRMKIVSQKDGLENR